MPIEDTWRFVIALINRQNPRPDDDDDDDANDDTPPVPGPSDH